MKKFRNVALLLATVTSVAVAQQKIDLDRVAEKTAAQLESRLPGWRYMRVEAFQPSSTIVVQTWCVPNRIVMVQFAIRETAEDAKKEIRSFLEFRRDPEELFGFGDEAFVPERNGSTVVLRKGRYVIYVSTEAHVDSDPDARNLTKAELEARHKAEVHRIGREFALHLSTIDLP